MVFNLFMYVVVVKIGKTDVFTSEEGVKHRNAVNKGLSNGKSNFIIASLLKLRQ